MLQSSANQNSFKLNLYRSLIYSLIYFSFAVLLLFTIGGVLFSVPPLCALLGMGAIPTYMLCVLCTVSSFWSSFVVQGTSIRDCLLQLAGLGEEIPAKNDTVKPSKLNIVLVAATWVFYSIFCIGGNYFGMLQILSFTGVELTKFTIGLALALASYHHLPTCAVYGRALLESALGYSLFKPKSELLVELIDLTSDFDKQNIQPQCPDCLSKLRCSTVKQPWLSRHSQTNSRIGRPILTLLDSKTSEAFNDNRKTRLINRAFSLPSRSLSA